MSVLIIFGPKCTMAASHAAPWWVTYVCQRDKQTDGRTPDRYIMLFARRSQRIKVVYCFYSYAFCCVFRDITGQTLWLLKSSVLALQKLNDGAVYCPRTIHSRAPSIAVQHIHTCKARSTPATMSKQRLTLLPKTATMSNEICVEISSFRQSRTLLRHCCKCGRGLSCNAPVS